MNRSSMRDMLERQLQDDLDPRTIWVIGMFEGEGTRTTFDSPRLIWDGTDLDTMERLRDYVGGNLQRGGYSKAPASKKKAYRVTVGGAEAVALAQRMYPHLSQRRREMLEPLINWEFKRRAYKTKKKAAREKYCEQV